MPLKRIGIIGGMGPEATADLYIKIVRWFQRERGAKDDADFPPMTILSVPVPDITKSDEYESVAANMLRDAAQTLDRDRCDFILLACNSAHFMLPQVRESVSIPVLDITEAVAAEVRDRGFRTVGLLATNVTLDKNVYDAALSKIGVEHIRPDDEDQEVVMNVICATLAGETGEKEAAALRSVIEKLTVRGAQAIVLACTDLPLVLEGARTIPVIDCNEAYARVAAACV